MSKIIKATENGITVTTELPDDAPRICGNGFGPALIGYPTTIVTVFQQQISESAKPNEADRKVVATLEVPTATIIELASTIVSAMQQNRAAVESAIDQIRSVLNKKI